MKVGDLVSVKSHGNLYEHLGTEQTETEGVVLKILDGTQWIISGTQQYTNVNGEKTWRDMFALGQMFLMAPVGKRNDQIVWANTVGYKIQVISEM